MQIFAEGPICNLLFANSITDILTSFYSGKLFKIVNVLGNAFLSSEIKVQASINLLVIGLRALVAITEALLYPKGLFKSLTSFETQ